MEKPYTLTAPESVPASFHEISHDLEKFRKEFPDVVKMTIVCQGCWCDKGDFIEIVPGKPFKCVHKASQPVRVAFDSSTDDWELIRKCPLLKSGVPFQLCKDTLMCTLRPGCTFAHSEIEKSVWELERTSKYIFCLTLNAVIIVQLIFPEVLIEVKGKILPNFGSLILTRII